MVDPGSDDMPDLCGEHVGRELHVGSKGKETVMVDNIAYHDGGLWYLDRWWPRSDKDTKVVMNNKIITSRINSKSISVAKLKMTNLVTKRIIISKSKAGDLLPTISSNTGKRFRDDQGEWWLREEDLTSSRRDPWPGWRYTPGISSTCT